VLTESEVLNNKATPQAQLQGTHDTERPLGHRRLSRRMTVATKYKQQVKKAVGRAGHDSLIRNKRKLVCLYTRLQWMQTEGAVCSQQPSSGQGLAFPRVERDAFLREKILGSKTEVRQTRL